ncbi:MAG: alpha/beta hydrolase [Acidobacteriia bacterium]|nr:alpha/beta hydrolase [Terriglobia bacterium]
MSANSVVPIVLMTAAATWAQTPSEWQDPSPHHIQFVSVQENVKLEVLDWGGSGRAVIFLPGLGNTAHVFDDFAPKLTGAFHVYGITRRGFGASSAPESGYDADRLGDDVLAVIDVLKISKPVLAGHSLGGEELSSVGTRHPEKVSGLIYLDAGYSYAFDNGKGMTTEAQNEAMKNPPPPGPLPLAADRASFAAFRDWNDRTNGTHLPESEVRQLFTARPDGGVGFPRARPKVSQDIFSGFRKYTEIRAPILAIFAIPHSDPPWLTTAKDDVREKTQAFNQKFGTLAEKQVRAFEQGLPDAHVVRIPNAHHYVFMTNEADVLRELRAFIARIK